MVELNHLDGVSDGVKREFDAFSDRNELVSLVDNAVGSEGGNRFEHFLELSVTLNVLGLHSSGLHIEHLTNVEEGLFFFTFQPVE